MADDYDTKIVKPGDRFSARAREVCVESFLNSSALTVVRAGSGMRAMDGFVWNKPVLEAMLVGEIYEVAQSDGAGGKPGFYTLAHTPEAFYGLGWEPITMNADDVACRGGLPVMMSSSNIDVKQITDENWHLCEALLTGLGKALKTSNLVLLTGETAVMPYSITAFCDTGSKSQLVMTWGATCLGLASTRRKPNGSTIRTGMKVVGFRDWSYRCNGGTKFIDIILRTWGPDVRDVMNNPDARTFIEKVAVPSQSYAGTIARLNGWSLDGSLGTPLAKLHGVAHITGGGIWSKLKEILPPGVGARLRHMPEPTSVLLEAQELARRAGIPMSGYDCHGTFHGGCGLLLVCEEGDVERVFEEARKDGHDPHLVGETFESADNAIRIISWFQGESFLSSLEPH